MKEYKEAIEKDNKRNRILSLGLIIVLGLMVITNIIAKNTLSAILTASMLIITIIVHFILEKEAKRKLSNLKEMFKKSKF